MPELDFKRKMITVPIRTIRHFENLIEKPFDEDIQKRSQELLCKVKLEFSKQIQEQENYCCIIDKYFPNGFDLNNIIDRSRFLEKYNGEFGKIEDINSDLLSGFYYDDENKKFYYFSLEFELNLVKDLFIICNRDFNNDFGFRSKLEDYTIEYVKDFEKSSEWNYFYFSYDEIVNFYNYNNIGSQAMFNFKLCHLDELFHSLKLKDYRIYDSEFLFRYLCYLFQNNSYIITRKFNDHNPLLAKLNSTIITRCRMLANINYEKNIFEFLCLSTIPKDEKYSKYFNFNVKEFATLSNERIKAAEKASIFRYLLWTTTKKFFSIDEIQKLLFIPKNRIEYILKNLTMQDMIDYHLFDGQYSSYYKKNESELGLKCFVYVGKGKYFKIFSLLLEILKSNSDKCEVSLGLASIYSGRSKVKANIGSIREFIEHIGDDKILLKYQNKQIDDPENYNGIKIRELNLYKCINTLNDIEDEKLLEKIVTELICRFLPKEIVDDSDVYNGVFMYKSFLPNWEVKVEEYVKSRDKFSVDEIFDVMRAEDNTKDSKFLCIGVANKYAIRIDRERFVKDATFDIDRVNELIEKVVGKRGYALFSEFDYNLFPQISPYPWNEYLLSSFCRMGEGRSGVYTIKRQGYGYETERLSGFVINERDGVKDFDEFVSKILANSNCDLNINECLEYLREENVITTKKYQNIQAVIQNAMAIRSDRL